MPMRAESCPASPTSGGPIGVNAAHGAAHDPSIRVIERRGRSKLPVNRAPLLKQCALEARIRLVVVIESPCSYGVAAGVAICGKRDANARLRVQL